MSQAARKNRSSSKQKKARPSASLNAQLHELRIATNAKISAGDGTTAVEILLDIIASQHHENARLAKQLDAAIRARFGRRSEKLTAEELGQLVLALGGDEQDAARADALVPADEPQEENVDADADSAKRSADPQKDKNRRHPGRTRLDPGLPRRITWHAVPDAERSCIHCGEDMHAIGHIDHERVEYIPARIEVAVDRCEKVACVACKQDITTAARPGSRKSERVAEQSASAPILDPQSKAATAQAMSTAVQVAGTKQDKATITDTRSSAQDGLAPGAQVYRRAGASLLAHLLEAKCDDALPVYRQRQQLARLGFDIPLNTLYGYWDAASEIIQPVAQIVLSCVLGQSIVGVDDTRLNWLDPQTKGKARRGHLWCFVGDGGLVAFEFTESWRADEVAPWIDAIDGYIQCDDYAGYGAMRPDIDGLKVPLVPPERRLGCWMHTRRPFHAAFKAGEKPAAIGLNYIKNIYAIERQAREADMTSDERLILRREKSLPLADSFFAWVKERSRVERPNSYLGKAFHYALDQKAFLLRCLTDGRFELDTGRVERQIREPVLGRKNYLFSGSADAARRLAGVYALVCSCQNLRINTRLYLTDIITKLQAGFPLREINRLRPDVWAAERSVIATDKLAQ